MVPLYYDHVGKRREKQAIVAHQNEEQEASLLQK